MNAMPDRVGELHRLCPPPGARIAVVGGAGAIGSAVVAALHAGGCRVAVLDTEAALSRASTPESVETRTIDLTAERSVEQAFGSLDALDGLVNCAGFTVGHDVITDLPTATWDAVHNVNLRGAFLVAKSALPLLRAGDQASLVLLSSVLGINTLAGYAHYGAAKAGIISLTRAIALENAPLVRANAVAPGAVETPFLSGGTGRPVEPRRLDATAYGQAVPLGRIAQVDDIVGPVLFLLGGASQYMTGQTLLVDGGLVPR